MSDPNERRHDMGRRYIDREVEHLREMLTQRLDLEKAALELQALEYERRLDVLNHAHEEARLVASETVTREKFDAYKTTQDLAFDTYKTAQEEKSAVAKRAMIASGIAVAGVLLNLTLYLLGWLRSP